jgi:predicted Zn finger-like uncharacterized protein
MIIACPACGARYRIDPTRIAKAVARVKCPRCAHLFELPLNPSPSPPGTTTVLVVDDSKFFRELVVDVLKPLGYAFQMAADGAEALAIIRRVRPALVILDLNLPGVDGYALLRQVRADAALSGIRLLAMSGVYRSEVDAAQVLASGADDFMGKSFNPEQLQSRVQRLLEGES